MTTEQAHPITLQTVLFVKSTVVAIQSHIPGEALVSASPENNIQVSKVDGHKGGAVSVAASIIRCGGVNPLSEPLSRRSIIHFWNLSCMSSTA